MTITKLVLTLIIIGSLSTLGSFAQVTIGSSTKPNRAAILDLKDKEAMNPSSVTSSDNISATTGGLLLPRVMLVNKNTLEPFISLSDSDWSNASNSKIKEKHAGLKVYNIFVSPDTETDYNKMFHQGVYIWNGNKWERQEDSQYFYLPSFNIPITEITGVDETIDLYAEYKRQFTKAGNPTFVSSNPNLETLPSPMNGKIFAPLELEYVVTYFDDSVVKVKSINEKGVLTYQILSLETTPDSFMNVAFVIK